MHTRRHIKRALSTSATTWSAWRGKHEILFPHPLHVFASCLPGLENILYHEIKGLGPNFVPFHLPEDNLSKSTHSIEPSEEPGGVLFRVSSLSQIFACHLYLGSASHILIRCGGDFVATDAYKLTQQVARMRFWKLYFPHQTDRIHLDIRVTSSRSRLYHTEVIAQCVEKGIRKALALHEPHTTNFTTHNPSNHEPIRILVRINKDRVQLSIDSSNTPIHRRGYRLENGKAPLREDIAFALLYPTMVLRQKQQKDPTYIQVVDPFCGSGTIVLEAAAIAMNLPPGRLRSSPFIPSRLLHSSQAWDDFVTLALSDKSMQSVDLTSHVAMGSDRDRGVIDAAWNNAARAGLQKFVHFQHCAISDNPWLQQSYYEQACTSFRNILVATNPPFGLRISNVSSTSTSNKKKNIHPLLPLYQTLGKLVNAMNYDACIMAHDVSLARRTGIPHLAVAFTTKHGGLSVSALSTSPRQ